MERQFINFCSNGYLIDAINFLQVNPHINISAENESAFRYACFNENLDVAKWLLEIKPTINISAENEEAFRWACIFRNLAMAQWLQSVKPNLYVINDDENGNYSDYYIRTEEEAANEKYVLGP